MLLIKLAKINNPLLAYTFTTKQAPLRLPSFTHFPLHPSIFSYL
jgi:ATP-dependent RNA helicase RhlE